MGRACYWIAGTTWADLRRNLTLANADYIASIFEAYHNRQAAYCLPCGSGPFTVRGREKDQIVFLGRIAPEKACPRSRRLPGSSVP